ncbi:pyrroloquinoline quinone biosynthesis protein PqqE [Algihabitans albus]|uniref:pyrroloquinoline quinone biosynthesis protein PqqE n=1 Tax=Algihabitans albus TaxID=2164067 RepID=UPI000E5CA045|nr:pyrroloquinoline quinone biosynthesis protein PqqE [Algihabitans albus]
MNQIEADISARESEVDAPASKVSEPEIPAPLGLLAELTHRCPLHCPYCSNPVELERRSGELDTATWKRVFSEAAALGVLQVHLSGGEPTARRDLEQIVTHCAEVGLYSNLITAGINLARARLETLADCGLDHVQLSVQAPEAAGNDKIAGLKGAFAHKLELAGHVRDLGLPLTLNCVIHRHNIDELDKLLELALTLGAHRLEIAHAQYYGWALRNRAALMPRRTQVEAAMETLERARAEHKGRLVIDAVVPDYYARLPKPCMGGWGRRSLNVTPSGKVLPCHAAETLPGLAFDNVRDLPLADIWYGGAAFNAYRGTDWMPEPCQSCERREIDWGGCRCQALALTGEAANTDPACHKSPNHAQILALAEADAGKDADFAYRGFSTVKT